MSRFFVVFVFLSMLAAACGVRSGFDVPPIGDGGAGGSDGGPCGPGTALCSGTCTVVAFDPNNCGACGTQCAKGQACSEGKCGLMCNGGATLCGSMCVDTQNDPANCGGCGKACPLGQVCSAGKCDLFCNGGTTRCNNVCVDTASDPNNCGFCGNKCPMGFVCNGQGGCDTKCGGGTTQCGQACVDTQIDPKNCGMCGKACASGEVCSQGACKNMCGGGLTQCGNFCVDTQNDQKNCGQCGFVCQGTDKCVAGKCTACDSSTTDCDGDGWKVSDGDCCDKPGPCGSEPKLVNPGAIEVVGNGIDDNCNGLVDLFDTTDTQPCDNGLVSSSTTPGDYAKAIGICRTTTANAPLKDKTWGLLDAKLVRADGSALSDRAGHSIRTKFGSGINALNGSSMIVLSNGRAADATQTSPGPNGGAPSGNNVSYQFSPQSTVNIASCNDPLCVKDWLGTANPPLKAANQLPAAPMCGQINNPNNANDSVMLVLTLRAPTNARAFSFNSFFFSAEYPEFVCSSFNDQFIALVDTPNGTPQPIPNPLDKNLMTFTQNNQKWPVAINIASGTSVFSVCDMASMTQQCSGGPVSNLSCKLGGNLLAGTGFEKPSSGNCIVGGGTYWLTTAGNIVPGDVLQLRIAIWDVTDRIFDSTALIDGFQWLANATLPGTSN